MELRYLVLFSREKCDAIYIRIRYLISQNSSITFVFPHHYARFRIDLYDVLLLEQTLTFHNVIILIKLVLNKS